MFLDLKTLLFCNIAIPFFIGVFFSFYKKYHKIYYGSGIWIFTFFLISFGYFSVVLFFLFPVWFCVIIPNMTFALVVVLRLDAIKRFTTGLKLNKAFYIFPVLTILSSLYFFTVDNNFKMRLLFSSIFLIIPMVFMSNELYSRRDDQNKNLYTAGTLLLVLYGLLIAIRVIAWMLSPGEKFSFIILFDQYYFLFITVLEIGIGICWLMMNSQKMEAELITTVGNLEKALSEVNTLSGIIPICMHCHGIRDDKGYWNRIEKFISEHSEAEFSHSICPECLKKKHPDFFKKINS